MIDMQVEKRTLSKALGALIAAYLVMALIPSQVHGQYYGEAEEKRIIIVDKTVIDFKDSIGKGGEVYSDNIDSSIKTFAGDDVLQYKIVVENAGTETLTSVKVVDRLPSNISLFFYPGNYNKETNTLEWTIDEIKPGETKEDILIRAKVSEVAELSATTPTKLCNEVIVDAGSGITDSDRACVYAIGYGVPKTGDASLLVKTVLISAAGSIGWFLRKLARGY